VVLECGTDTPWICPLLDRLGHEVILAHPRQLVLISKSFKKTDRADAELLARMGRADPKMLSPVKPRDPKVLADLAVIDARNCLVQARTKLVNFVRSKLKTFSVRVKACSTSAFALRAAPLVPTELKPALMPALAMIRHHTVEIRKYDRKIEEICEKKYPETALLGQVTGVGLLTALAYALIVQDPKRFRKSRQVGAYLGLTPRRDDSGMHQPQLRITKAGDSALRALLVSSAHYILGRFGPDTDLRRHGQAIAARGGPNAKKKAVIAVARKLAVLLHRLWITGEVYEPLRNSRRREAKT
jgi:transposase